MIEYDPHSWPQHLFDIKGSMLREITGRVTAVLLWSIAVVYLDLHVRQITIPSTVHTLVGMALGLLLVFRTNASYDRFWEGRRMWGGIVNETRNLGRSSSALILRLSPDLHTEILRATVAWTYSAMYSLRGTRSLGPMPSGLSAEVVTRVMASPHVPLGLAIYITEKLSEARSKGLVSEQVFVAIDQNVQLLIDYMGACERIRRTPLPFAYVVHLRRALILYCITLPVALVDSFGWAAVPATFLTAYLFFGIEEIGVEIEDPFGVDDNDLPLESICQTIQRDLGAMIPKAPENSETSAP